MTIKEMREQAGLKQAELAAISGVNLRSLQDYEQGHKSLLSAKGETLLRLSHALGYSVEDILMDYDVSLESCALGEMAMRNRLMAYENAIRERKTKEVHFPVIVADECVDMSRIYPTKQRVVKQVLDSLREDSRINSLFLFGSSISMACNKDSDVDFAIGLKEMTSAVRNDISQKIQLASDWRADILWLDHLTKSDRVYQDIMKGLRLI